MRALFLSLALLLLALSLLTVVRAWNTAVWKAAIVAGEFGHYLGLLSLGLVCLILAHGFVIGVETKAQGWLAGVAALLALGATGLFFLPAVMAMMIGQRLPGRMSEAFNHRVDSRRVLDFREMLLPLARGPEVPVSTRVFTRAGTPEALSLDFYAAQGERLRPAPCVVVIHGGGWDGGDRLQMQRFNHLLAQRGYAVAAISYRLAPKHPWPAQREDTLAAINWLKAHSDELAIDPGRLVLLGRSAGAQIASAVAYGVVDPAIRGVIGLYGVYDMEFVWSISREDDVLNSVKLMRQFLGGGPTIANQAAYDSASAQGLVRSDRTPPTLLMHGTIDTLCWVEHSRRLAARLESADVDHVMIELPWAVHAFDYHLHGPGGQLTTYAVDAFLAAVCSP